MAAIGEFGWKQSFLVALAGLFLLLNLSPAAAALQDETQDPGKTTSPASQDESDKPKEEKPKKEKRGSIVAAPIPISSPAIGSGAILAGGYIFALRKSDKVSQPSTVASAVLITNNGSRGFGLGGEFYLKENTYHITTIYFRGNLNYDFYGVGTAQGDENRKLPLKQAGQLFLGDFLYRLKWKFSAGPRFVTGNSTITLRQTSEENTEPPPDIGLDTRLTSLGFHINRDTRLNRFYPSGGTVFDFTGMYFAQGLGSKYSFDSYRLTFNYYRSFGERHVLAYNFFNCATTSGAPFYGQCVFGTNSELRGYVAGQYIDSNMFATQVEYRLALPWRLGIVAFAGVGAVAPGISNFGADDLLPAGGGGIRFKLSQKYKLNFRADLAQGKDGHTFSMGVGEAF